MIKMINKIITLLLLLFSVLALSGCVVLNTSSQESKNAALRAIGIAYSPGEYSLECASCTGYITSSQSSLFLEIPTGKRFLDNQSIVVVSLDNAELRTNGSYVLGYLSNLSQYIYSVNILNDGSIIQIRLDNPAKWKSPDNVVLLNNSPVVGNINISFVVSES